MGTTDSFSAVERVGSLSGGSLLATLPSCTLVIACTGWLQPAPAEWPFPFSHLVLLTVA